MHPPQECCDPPVKVQLDGPALVPSFNSSCCKETLLRRHVKHYNHQAGTARKVGRSSTNIANPCL